MEPEDSWPHGVLSCFREEGRRSTDDLRLVIGLLSVNRYLFNNHHVWALGLALGDSCEHIPALNMYIPRWRNRDFQCCNNPFTPKPGDMPMAADQQTDLRMVT